MCKALSIYQKYLFGVLKKVSINQPIIINKNLNTDCNRVFSHHVRTTVHKQRKQAQVIA